MIPFSIVGAVLGLALALAFLLWRTTRFQGRTINALQRDLAASKADADRLAHHAERLVTPLAWAWIAAQDAQDFDLSRRLRHGLASAFVDLQAGLAVEDTVMADLIEAAPEPPRRLPRYAAVPPYLATPADVVGVPAAMVRDLRPVETSTTTDADPRVDRPHDLPEEYADVNRAVREEERRLAQEAVQDVQRGPRDPFAGTGDG